MLFLYSGGYDVLVFWWVCCSCILVGMLYAVLVFWWVCCSCILVGMMSLYSGGYVVLVFWWVRCSCILVGMLFLYSGGYAVYVFWWVCCLPRVFRQVESLSYSILKMFDSLVMCLKCCDGIANSADPDALGAV